MPRIVVQQHARAHPGEFIQQGIAGAGQAIAHGLERRDQMLRQAQADELANRRLDIEEARAKATLARQAQLDASHQAEMQDVTGRLQESGNRQAGMASVDALQGAGGAILGPFGGLNQNAIAKSAEQWAQTQQDMQGKIALAKEMSPAAARGYLTRELGDEKQKVIARGYQQESEALQKAVADGVIDEGTQKRYSKLLQTSLREGRSPGPIHTFLAREYDKHAKLVQRSKDWVEADKKANEMLASAEQLFNASPEGIDPVTGKSMRETLRERLAAVKGEWANTEFPSHRMETDPGSELGNLQKLLFGMHGAAGGEIPQTGSQRSVAQGLMTNPAARGALRAGPQTTPAARASMERQPAGVPAKKSPGRTQAPHKLTGAEDEKALRGYVSSNAQKALSNPDRKAGIKELLEGARRDLGMNASAQDVLAVVQDELQKVIGKPGAKR